MSVCWSSHCVCLAGYVMAVCLSLCLSVCLSVTCSGVVISAGCCNVHSCTTNNLCVCWSSHSVSLAGYVMAMCLSLCLSVCLCVRCSGVVISAGCCNVHSCTSNNLCVCWSSHCVCLAGYVIAVCLSLCLSVCVLDAAVLSSVQDATMFTALHQ